MAKKNRDKNYVSIWFWMFAPLVAILPCIGFIMILIWAFVGENESRKNFFRATLVWHLICLVFMGITMALCSWPEIHKQIHIWLNQIK